VVDWESVAEKVHQRWARLRQTVRERQGYLDKSDGLG